MPNSILVVEDDLFLSTTIQKALTAAGYKVNVAATGTKALDIITEEKIDLIICDIMIPEISGISFINSIKSQSGNEVPVIIISSLGSGEHITKGLIGKKNHFMSKPIVFPKLLSTVEDLIKHSHENTNLPH